jgi:hypothetical protein
MLAWVPLGSTAFFSSLIRNDHPPPHVHGFASETEAIIDLRPDGTIALAKRTDAVTPANAKRSDVRRILIRAAMHFEELVALWEEVHGKK